MMMELQLGLALPTNATTIKGLDLNSYVYDPKEATASSGRRLNQHYPTLQLGLHPWLYTSNDNDDDDFTTNTTTNNNNNNNKKRSFGDAFKDIRNDVVFVSLPPTLPLLLWNNQPNEDDDPKDSDNTSSFAFNKVDEDCDGIVGWPPIKFRRKKICYRRVLDNNRTVDNGCIDCHGRLSNSMFIKVKMEGVAIARKIDISLYNSFQPLKQTLLAMFGIFLETDQENSSNYKLTYQDREGDWLLADDDVSWRSFIRSVQRLKLMRGSG